MSTDCCEALVVGAGISGLATALSLAKSGITVRVTEQKPALDQLVSSRPSINLTLGIRGLDALRMLGLEEQVADLSVTATVRHIHNHSGAPIVQPYGLAGEAVRSLRRGDLVSLLLHRALSDERITMRFGERLLAVEHDGTAVVQRGGKEAVELRSEFVVGADGLNSVVRQAICRDNGVPDVNPLSTGTRWLELKVTSSWPGADRDAVDVWPRAPLMLIAFPNRDGVKTALLFAIGGAPFPKYEQLRQIASELRLRREAYETSLRNHDEVRLVKCPAWSSGRRCILGDAAHAMAPFLGQGANAALADARELITCINESSGWEDAAQRFESIRRPEMECLARLTDQYCSELSRNIGDGSFALRRDLRLLLGKYSPGQFQPIYNRIAFSLESMQAAEQDYAAEESKLDVIFDAAVQALKTATETHLSSGSAGTPDIQRRASATPTASTSRARQAGSP